MEEERSRRRFSHRRVIWDPHSKPGLPHFLLNHTEIFYPQLSRFLCRLPRLGTQDPFGVSSHRKFHFVGAHKAAESLRHGHTSYSVTTALAKQKRHQQQTDTFRGRGKQITQAQGFGQQQQEWSPGWSRSVWARTLFVLYLPLQHSQEHKTHPDKTICLFSSFLFMSCFIFADCLPLSPPRFPVTNWKLQKEKQRRKELFRQRADSLKGRAHTENTVTVFWAQSWHQALPAVVGLCSPGSASGFGTMHLEKGGSCSSCTSSSSLLDEFLAKTAAWEIFAPLHLLPAATQGRGLASFCLSVVNRNLNPIQRFFLWTFSCKNQFGCSGLGFFFTIKQRHFSGVWM